MSDHKLKPRSEGHQPDLEHGSDRCANARPPASGCAKTSRAPRAGWNTRTGSSRSGCGSGPTGRLEQAHP